MILILTRRLVKILRMRAYTTLLEYFVLRKYTIVSQVCKQIRYISEGNEGIAIFVVHASNIKAILANLVDNYSLITIVCHTITSNLKKIALASDGKIEFFQYDELQFNIIDHAFQPKFTVLSTSEADDWKRCYLKSIKSYPKILVSDPVSRALKLKSLDIVKIERYEDEGPNLISYSIVI